MPPEAKAAFDATFATTRTGAWWMAVPLLIRGTMAFLSGSFFPIDSAPDWLQAISLGLPLRHLNEAMTDVMVRGQGAATTLVLMAILLGFALVVGAVAARLFRWDTD